MPKLTDEELIAAIEQEESVALAHQSGQLKKERADAWARYRGEPLGNEIEGRSQIVDKGLMDTVQWIIPSLVRIYLGGDDIGQFAPVGPEDEYAAQCETEVCNWYLQEKNDFFSHIVSALTSALVAKNGYLAGNWTRKTDVQTEKYRGMADEEFAMLLQDPDVTVVAHTETQDPVLGTIHDVDVERKKADEYVAVEAVPTDEILVSRRHRQTSLLDADFVQWRRRVSIAQLRAEGFKVDDDVAEAEDIEVERIERDRFNDEWRDNDETPDPARKIVLFKDTYIRINLSGDKGETKLWRVAFVDGVKKPALKEEADTIPFAAFSPLIYPHSHVGTSIYDLINDLTLIKTMMERQLVDGTFLQTAGRMAVDVNTVNIDDLLVSRPGALVRVEGDPSVSLFPIQTPDVGPTVLASLEYMDNIGERRTGVTRGGVGLDPNSLNKTATGTQQLQAAANQRIEMIARTMAGGFRDLFLIIHTLASHHSTKPVQLKLKGKWTAIDPRSWAKRTDFKINVGLGTGTPAEQAQKLLMMAAPMQQAQAMGLAGPQEGYNFISEMWKALGYKSVDKFLHPPQPKVDPQTGQPIPGQFETPPPPKDPAVQVAEINAQVKQGEIQAKSQADAQKSQQDAAMKQQEIAMQAQAKEREQQNALVVQQQNDARDDMRSQREHERELQRIAIEAQLKEREMLLNAEIKREEIASKERATVRAAELGAQSTAYSADRTAEAAHKTAESKKQPENKPARGYKVVRGPDGRASQLDIIR